MPKPDLLSNMSLQEKQKRIIKKEPFYLIDKKIILTKGNLFIKIKESDSFMYWEVWVELGKKEFLKVEKNSKCKIKGKLFAPIHYYLSSGKLELVLNYNIFDTDNPYPRIELTGSQYEMEQDYANGVSMNKVIQWMKDIYHN